MKGSLEKDEIRKFFGRYKSGSVLLADIERAKNNWCLLAEGRDEKVKSLGRSCQMLVGLFQPWLWISESTHAKRHWAAEQGGFFFLAAEILLRLGLLEEAAKRDGFSFARFCRLLAEYHHSLYPDSGFTDKELEWLKRCEKICDETGQTFELGADGRSWLVPEEKREF